MQAPAPAQPAPDATKPFLLFLRRHCHPNTRKCFGCGNELQDLAGFVIVALEIRNNLGMPSNAYYHYHEPCVQIKHSSFKFQNLWIEEDVVRHLTPAQKIQINNDRSPPTPLCCLF